MSRTADPALARGGYPERAEVPEGALDRLVSQLGWRLHRIFRRRVADPARFAAAVRAHAERLRDEPLAPRLPDLRYRLRSNGFSDERVAECLALYCAALARAGNEPPSPEALAAARELVAGRIVDLAEPQGRVQALALAACALAIHGTPVHLLVPSEARARRSEAHMRSTFEMLGLSVGLVTAGMPPRAREAAYRSAVVCSAHRDVAVAYLQDRLQMAGKSRLLLRALGGEAARADKSPPPLLPGLCFALVDEADLVMLDDIFAPVTISIEADQAQERLLYEQTLELARAFEPESDFAFDDEGLRLTEAGSERLARLVAPLGGVWGAQQRREDLVTTALIALHACERGVDYQVTQGRVVFPNPDPGAGEQDGEPDPALVKLVELKEGCRLAGARDVLARIPVPRFFRRYLSAAGVCADARGLEEDFWVLYGLKTTLVGRRSEGVPCRPRVFRTVEAKRAAVLDAVRAHAADGAVVVAARSPREAQALTGELAQAGLTAGLLRGAMDDAERAVLAGLDRAGSVAVTLFPAQFGVNRARRSEAPLYLIVAELHDAARHVSQIGCAFGAGAGEMLLSLDEEGVAAAGGKIALELARLRDAAADELPSRQARWIAGLAQREAENSRVSMRRDLMLRDEYLSALLAFSGRGE